MRVGVRILGLLLCAAGLTGGCGRIAGQPDHGAMQAAATASAGTSHPADAVCFQQHWYLVIMEKTSWVDAQEKCQARGGHLAVVDSAEKQQFIAKLADERRLFLGATDEPDGRTWRWVDGAPFSYTCWMEGQPNNYGGKEFCLATYDRGEWVDVDNDGDGFWMPTGFICEWDK